MAILSAKTVATEEGFKEIDARRYCEPYVLVICIDLSPAQPEVEALLYGSWRSHNSKKAAATAPLVRREGCWELDIVADAIAKPDDAIFLVALMEHLDTNPSTLQNMINTAVM